jgi:hypothetical protein
MPVWNMGADFVEVRSEKGGEGEARGVTLKELSQLYYLNREIEMDARRLEELEAKVQPGGRVLTGMPRVRGAGDAVGSLAAEIADLRGCIEAKRRQCLYERNRLERYISGIDDSLTRQIFAYRFVSGLSWEQVAACIGGGNSAGSVRMTCYRRLKRK